MDAMAPEEAQAREISLAINLIIISAILAILSGSFYLVGMPWAWAQAPLIVAIVIWFALAFWWTFRDISYLITLLGMSFMLMVLSGVFYVAGIPASWARALFLATVIIWIVLGVAVMIKSHQDKAAYVLRQQQRGKSTGASTEVGDEDEGE
jgi:hypothetical protein